MKRAGPGWLLLALAGLAAVFGAFLPFYTYANGVDVTVWSRGLFPTAALIPLLGVAVGLEALFVLVRGHEPRSPFLNFTWEQVRLAAGAFMILLALSYLLHDRAGGSLGTGYALLSASALATFGGGVLTRRAQLARAPGEEATDREHRPVVGPALAGVGRASSDLVKNMAERGHSMRVRLAERREARAAARKDAAEKAAAQRAEMQAAAANAAAANAAAANAAAEKAATEEAATDRAEHEEPVEHPPPPATTLETLPTEAHPPAATLDELPAEEPVEHPPPPHATIDEQEAAADPSPAEPDDTAELPVASRSDAVEEKTSEQPRVAKLSAVALESEPDSTPPPDGKSGTVPHGKNENENENEKETERADTGTEGSPSG